MSNAKSASSDATMNEVKSASSNATMSEVKTEVKAFVEMHECKMEDGKEVCRTVKKEYKPEEVEGVIAEMNAAHKKMSKQLAEVFKNFFPSNLLRIADLAPKEAALAPTTEDVDTIEFKRPADTEEGEAGLQKATDDLNKMLLTEEVGEKKQEGGSHLLLKTEYARLKKLL